MKVVNNFTVLTQRSYYMCKFSITIVIIIEILNMKNIRHFTLWPARFIKELQSNIFHKCVCRKFYVVHHYCSSIAVFHWLYSTAVKPKTNFFSQQLLEIILSCRC